MGLCIALLSWAPHTLGVASFIAHHFLLDSLAWPTKASTAVLCLPLQAHPLDVFTPSWTGGFSRTCCACSVPQTTSPSLTIVPGENTISYFQSQPTCALPGSSRLTGARLEALLFGRCLLKRFFHLRVRLVGCLLQAAAPSCGWSGQGFQEQAGASVEEGRGSVW